eukprot:11032393-Lingulodinium_polyedra.AAC.1
MAFAPLSGQTPRAPCGPSSQAVPIRSRTSTSASPGLSALVPSPRSTYGRPFADRSAIRSPRMLTLRAVALLTCPT